MNPLQVMYLIAMYINYTFLEMDDVGIVDYCSQQPCNNGGTCLNFKVSYLCECVREKWRGRNCEIGT